MLRSKGGLESRRTFPEAWMNPISRTARTLLVVVSLTTVAACGGAILPDVDFGFSMPRDVQLDAAGTSVNGVFAFDLSSNATVQQYKSHVKALSFDSVDVLVTDTTTSVGANAANSLTGTVALRPGGAANAAMDVQVGSLTNFAIAKNATITLAGNAALNAFALSALQGSGQFSVVVSGTTTPGAAHLLLHLVPHLKLTYSP